MFGFRTRALAGIAWLAAACGTAGIAQAQFGPFSPYSSCGCGAPMAAIAQPVYAAAAAPACNCPCMQVVQEPVYQTVQAVEYKTVHKPVKVARIETAYEERPVTRYQTVMEPQIQNVTSYVNQTISECQPVTVNQSYWRTAYQPINKTAPCMYDQRPGLLGEFNRLGLAFRNSLTPNYTARREYVPNIMTAQVQTQRVVQVPTTQQVTVNVPRTVAVQEMQKVAVQKTVWEDRTITAYEPYTVSKVVQVGSQSRYAFVDPNGNTATANAGINPTVAKDKDPTKSADGRPLGQVREQSAPANEIPLKLPTYQANPLPEQDNARPVISLPPTANNAVPNIAPAPQGEVVVTAWRATRPEVLQAESKSAPAEIKVVQSH